ncbi:lysylphosphatidylglycerol synthase transmembrane domain-containing protein [Hymenobacter ruricola]|uniref:Flippase-like domain-containing protein n=1 Tax=Hymenobacter ruricola TaxID=2791023 RepID=A0ABS0I9R0_9BACT|nr:lysylphosphatidylglycerol synthase transmembrane domain-containing protein [Hymenobacter ruricola]MBF9223690.1 flippase-like domain-containing protein [Hymenobacter ruricola]
MPKPQPPTVTDHDAHFLQRLRPSRLILPVALGLLVVGYLFWHNYKPGELAPLAHADWRWLAVAILVLAARDLGYIYRIRHIAETELTYRQALDVIVIWEFASCVLPSGQGGTGAAPFILEKEGIPLGKGLAYIMVTALLDNLYYVVMVPLVVLIAGAGLYPHEALQTGFVATLRVAFGVSYLFVTLYAGLMLYAIFVNPRSVRRLMVRLFSLPLLRRWRRKAYHHGQELVRASIQLRGNGPAYWWRASVSTAFVWTARYAIIGCLIAAFVPMDAGTFLFIFARNITYKVILLVAITPGGAGIAEGAFPTFFGKFIGTATMTGFLVFLYRIVTYYLYLVLGLIFLPRWVARVFGKRPAAGAVAS